MLHNLNSTLKLACLFFILLFASSAPAFADPAENPEFVIALKLYENLQYQEALKKFEKLSHEGIASDRQVYSVFYAKTLIKLNQYKEAVAFLDKLLNSGLHNLNADEVRLTFAQACASDKNYPRAFFELLILAEKSTDNFYKNYAKKSALKIGENHLGSSEFLKYLAAAELKNYKPLIKLLLGKSLLKENKFEEARAEFLDILQQYPSSQEREEANSLYIKAIELNKGGAGNNAPVSLIGVMLPLSGNQGSGAANEILQGVKYAVAEFNDGREDRIGLVIKDTERKTEKIGLIKKELSAIPDLKAIIGPVYSGEVREALQVFKDEKIVLISPTATDNDLTHDNENFFQANPNFTVRGKVMAQYIYYVENKRRMAVLNALEGYGPILANSFISEFERLGGRIILKETYKSGSFSLESPISKIASSSDQFEGIYIPLTDKIDAPVILSQLELRGIKLPIYGDQDWLYAKGLEASSELSNQLTFTSDYFIDFNSFDFTEFNKNFFDQTKTDVNRNVLYGYDTAKYLLTVLRNFSGSPNMVKQKMESDMTVNGFHNNICFDEMRINKFLNIVRYRDGKFDLVDEFKLN